MILSLVSGCKIRTYQTGSVTDITTLTVGSKADTNQFKVSGLTDLPTFTADSSLSVSLRDGTLVVTRHQKIISTRVHTVTTYNSLSVEKLTLRTKRDSMKQVVKLARIDLRKDKPGFMGNLRKIIGQLKWILLSAALLVITLIILKKNKWLH